MKIFIATKKNAEKQRAKTLQIGKEQSIRCLKEIELKNKKYGYGNSDVLFLPINVKHHPASYFCESSEIKDLNFENVCYDDGGGMLPARLHVPSINGITRHRVFASLTFGIEQQLNRKASMFGIMSMKTHIGFVLPKYHYYDAHNKMRELNIYDYGLEDPCWCWVLKLKENNNE